MGHSWADLEVGHLDALGACGRCTAWQLPAVAALRPDSGTAGAGAVKARWLTSVLAEPGGVGLVLLDDGVPCGAVLTAPDTCVPRSGSMPTAPVSADAVLLVGLVATHPTDYRRLVHRLVRELRRRGVRSVEAYGGPGTPPGCLGRPATHGMPCRFPAAALERLGFRLVRPHPVAPRYRLDVRSAVVADRWASAVETARGLSTRPVAQPSPSPRSGV